MTSRKQIPVKIEGIEAYQVGSNPCYHAIINRIRPHNTFVVPFLGNCTVTRHIKQAHLTIGNDMYAPIVEKWQAMNFDWIELHNKGFMDFLESLDFSALGKVAMFVEPTHYKQNWLSEKKTFEHEMTTKQHEQLLEYILTLPANVDVIIKTYPNKRYSELLKGWHNEKFTVYTQRRHQVEQLFCNYDPPFNSLHDYSYCGEDYRERERRKKKTKNIARGLLSRPLVEQRAILDELYQIVETNASYAQKQAEEARTQAVDYYRSKEQEGAA